MRANSKYIIVPEFKPLFAMARCYGPSRGPLKPTLTPIDVIRDLLGQSGRDKITIYETVPTGDKKIPYKPAVQLTLDNYMLPYDEIAGVAGNIPDAKKEESPEESPAVVKVVEKDPKPVESPESVKAEEKVEELSENPAEEAIPVDPYAGMTKRQRREARRAAAELAESSGNDN